ncbi:unannotated protein [freshwater metagenome]|uniref:Unannotated protein n=1 Tax=freshwater metagenome TaxID=449393 RepID=A0A6J7EYA8_9ZZZZ
MEGLPWVRSILSDGTREPFVVAVPSGATADFIWAAIEGDCLAGLAHASIKRGLPATPGQAEAVADRHRLNTAFDLLAEAALHDLHALLAAAGIEWRILKGLATAHLWYDSPDQRHTADVDLLVHEADFWRAIELLGAQWPRAIVFRSRASQAAANQATFVHPSGVEIDLHRWVTGFLPEFRLPESLWWEQPQEFRLSWGEASAMSPDLMAFHVLLHLTSSSVRLTSVADLLRALERDDIDWDRVLGLARGRGLRTPLWWGAERAAVWAQSPRLDDLIARLRPGRLHTLLGPAILQSPLARQIVFHASTPHRARRLIDSLRPTPEFVAWRANEQTAAANGR